MFQIRLECIYITKGQADPQEVILDSTFLDIEDAIDYIKDNEITEYYPVSQLHIEVKEGESNE